MSKNYHFHKDCAYYPQCKEEVVKIGKQKRIRFTCPMMRYSQLYFLNDLHRVKWCCTEFRPYQTSLPVNARTNEN